VTIDAKVDTDGDGMNDALVDPMAATGTVKASTLRVRARPNGKEVGFVHAGDKIQIYGKIRGWFAFAFNGKTAFVYSDYVDI
jgi:hypothetical protein